MVRGSQAKSGGRDALSKDVGTERGLRAWNGFLVWGNHKVTRPGISRRTEVENESWMGDRLGTKQFNFCHGWR